MQVDLRPFMVAKLALDRSQVNPQTIAQLAAEAAGSGVKVDTDWTALGQRALRNDALDKDDLHSLQDFAKLARAQQRDLKAELRESGWKDQAVEKKYANVNVFTHSFGRLDTALRLAGTQTALQAAGGASLGAAGTVAAYASYARLTRAALTDLVDTMKGIEAGKSQTLFTGNRVEQVHQERLWPAMNGLLDSAVEDARKGKPVEVDAQYYELTSPQIVGKLAAAAAAGNKVRVNVDPGRLVAFKGSTVNVDDVPDKLHCLLQLARSQGDIGVSTYPIDKQLGDPNDLMHRKLLRVGERVLLPGMNANAGSGENVDAGYIIEGPAGRQLVDNFARDVKNSTHATNSDVFGQKPLADFMDGDVRIGARGLAALVDFKAGLSPAGSALTPADGLKDAAEKAGLHLEDLVDGNLDSALRNGYSLPLARPGKELFMQLLDETLKATRTDRNVAQLQDIQSPSGHEVGTTAVSLADQPKEREALLIAGIQEAEKFIYIPAFVMTRPVAAALVARRDELKAQGKELDLKVMVDPGVYPDGCTPNEFGVEFLEDHDVPVHWALLPRSGDHDRKVHAKQMLTDKSEFFGSTNFSNKGMMDNWEHSGVVHFDANNLQDRDESKARFEKMWERESFELNSEDLAALWKSRYQGKDAGGAREAAKPPCAMLEAQIEDARYGAVKKTINAIESFEKESATFMQSKAQDPQVAARVQELTLRGADSGMALLTAVEETMGTDDFYQALGQLPSRRQLEELRPQRKAA